MDNGDRIQSINGKPLTDKEAFETYIKTHKIGDTLKVDFKRFGIEKTTTVVLEEDPTYAISLLEKEGDTPSAKVLVKRLEWLKVE